MTSHAFHQVLVLLDDDERAMWSVLERAIEIAEVERARLTIAKTTDPGRMVKWLAPAEPLDPARVRRSFDWPRSARRAQSDGRERAGDHEHDPPRERS
jgi:hypothetical protein